jgi:pilus assembly protein TadC
MIVLVGLGGFSAAGDVVLAMLLAGLAGWIAMPSGAVSRIHPMRIPDPPRWAMPVPGAAPVKVRVLAGMAVAVAVMLGVPGPVMYTLPGGLLLGVGVSVAAGRLESASSRRLRQQRVVAMPDVLMLLAGTLEVGAPLRTAVGRVIEFGDDPCTEDLRGLASRISAGVPDEQAWRALAAASGWEDVARDVARAVSSGEGVASLLRAHAEEMRTVAAEQAEKKARKAGVSAIVPLICCHLPAFLLIGVVPIVAGTIFKSL